MPSPTSIAELRNLTPAELTTLGEQSLRDHVLAQAIVAHQKYPGLPPERLDAYLRDAECVRYPTRLVFEFGDMALHQFAQPDRDWRSPEPGARVLYLRPQLRSRPDWIRLAVAYMTPVINYGDLATDELCVLSGATLLGMMADAFYDDVCAMADATGAEVKEASSD